MSLNWKRSLFCAWKGWSSQANRKCQLDLVNIVSMTMMLQVHIIHVMWSGSYPAMLKISVGRLIRFSSSSVADARLVTPRFPVDVWPLVQRTLRTCCWISTELRLCFLLTTVKSETISMLAQNKMADMKTWGWSLMNPAWTDQPFKFLITLLSITTWCWWSKDVADQNKRQRS